MAFHDKPSMKQYLSQHPPSYWPKLRQAEFHLQSIHDEIIAFLRDHTCGVREHVQPKGYFRKRIWRFVDIDTYPPAYDWGVLIGDFVHNVRSALDNLVYQAIVGAREVDARDDKGYATAA